MKKKDYVQTLVLTYRRAHFSLLIQLDKPIYRPGDLVRLRVLAIDSETRPYNVPSAIVSILDSGSNLVKSFTNISFVKGKYEGSFQLSDNPPMNQWTVSVSAESEVSETKISEFLDYSTLPIIDCHQEFRSSRLRASTLFS